MAEAWGHKTNGQAFFIITAGSRQHVHSLQARTTVPSQSQPFSLFSWQTQLGWVSVLNDFFHFGKQSKPSALAARQLVLSTALHFCTCCWAEEAQALPLSESLDLPPRLPQGHPGASTLTSSLPMSTQRLPPHLFSLSPLFHLCLTDHGVYKCCLVSGICLGHQKMCPAVSGGAVTQFRLFACTAAPAELLLLPGCSFGVPGEVRSENYLCRQPETPLVSTRTKWGCIKWKVASQERQQSDRASPCAPKQPLSFWDERRAWGGAPSPQHSLVLPPLCLLHSRGSSSQEKGGTDPGRGWFGKGSCWHWFSVEKFSVSKIILRRKALFSTESHLFEGWKILSCASPFFWSMKIPFFFWVWKFSAKIFLGNHWFLWLCLLPSACPWRKNEQKDNYQKKSCPSGEHRRFYLLSVSQQFCL